MNRKEWYKQRRLYRITRLVSWSQGDEVCTKVYNKLRSFPDSIKASCLYFNDGSETEQPGTSYDTDGYNMKKIFSKISMARKLNNPEHLTKYKETVRGCMRSNAAKPRLSSCSCTPVNYFRGF